MSDKLKPCPFCGGKAILSVNEAMGVPTGDNGWQAIATCQNRECSVTLKRWALKRTWAEKAAITAWNRRPAPHKYTVEELREKAKEPLKHWVWIEDLNRSVLPALLHSNSAYLRTHADYTKGEAFCCGFPGLGFHFDYDDYNKTWVAYDREPEGDI